MVNFDAQRPFFQLHRGPGNLKNDAWQFQLLVSQFPLPIGSRPQPLLDPIAVNNGGQLKVGFLIKVVVQGRARYDLLHRSSVRSPLGLNGNQRVDGSIPEELCGLEVSSAQISRAAQLLDQELHAWRTRELGEVAYLILDTRYERVRVDGVVRDCAVLVAIGVLPDGYRSVLHAKDSDAATEELNRFSMKYESSAPKLVAWAQDDLPEGLAVLALPSAHCKRMRTTNMLERQNKEIKRRTRVATLFPNEASLLRLVTAVLIEINDEWIGGKIYLKFET